MTIIYTRLIAGFSSNSFIFIHVIYSIPYDLDDASLRFAFDVERFTKPKLMISLTSFILKTDI